MASQSTVESVRRKFVSAQDINQLRQCFYAMEDIAQKSIASKNKQIADLTAENADLKQKLDAHVRAVQTLENEINTGKDRLKQQYPAMQPKGNTLLDFIEAAYLIHQREIQQMQEQIRGIENALQQLDGQARGHHQTAQELARVLENLKGMLGNHPVAQRSRSTDVQDMLRDRLAYEEELNRENENRLRGSAKRIADLEAMVEQMKRDLEALAQRERDLAQRDAAIRDVIGRMQFPRLFKFVQPGRVDSNDIAGLINQRDREATAELQARDQDSDKAKAAIQAMEADLVNAGKEIERLRKDIAVLQQTADARQQEIARLQDHIQNQGGVIQRQAGEIAERDRQVDDSKRRLNELENALQENKQQLAAAEEELRNRGVVIDKLQNQVRDANEDVANKLVALSMILEKLTQAREEFEAKDAEIEALHNTLSQVERERLEKESALKQFKSDEFNIVDEMSHAGGDLGLEKENRNKLNPQTVEEQELNRLFQSARETLGVLGQKASYSYAALKTKDDLDALYDEQLTVTGAEMILRDKKINLLVEKVIIAERFINDVLRLLGQADVIKPSASAGMKFRQDAAPSGSSSSSAYGARPSGAYGGVPMVGMTGRQPSSASGVVAAANRSVSTPFDPRRS